MIQHVCDRCGKTMKEWRVVGLSEKCDATQGLYDVRIDRMRFEQQTEICLICEEEFRMWLVASVDQTAAAIAAVRT